MSCLYGCLQKRGGESGLKNVVLDDVGLILVGHGSKLPYNRVNLEKLANILHKRSSLRLLRLGL